MRDSVPYQKSKLHQPKQHGIITVETVQSRNRFLYIYIYIYVRTQNSQTSLLKDMYICMRVCVYVWREWNKVIQDHLQVISDYPQAEEIPRPESKTFYFLCFM